MKLYSIAISPNCRKVEATIYKCDLEKAVKIERHEPASGFHKSDAYLQLNPNGRYPVLEAGEKTIWESSAIVHYLCSLASNSSFYPQGGSSLADILRWQFWEALHYNKAIGTICWETLVKPMVGLGEADTKLIETGTAQFHEFAPILDRQLASNRFVMGDDLTVADYSVASHCTLALHADSQVPLTDYPNIHRYYTSMETDSAWCSSAP